MNRVAMEDVSRVSVVVIALLITCVWSSLVQASVCNNIKALKISGVEILETEDISGDVYTAPDGKEYSVIDFCRVHGVARPTSDSTINFEVWLPEKNWNGRFYQVGTGGFAGRIMYPRLAEQLVQGSAVATTDMGHKGDGADASWALGHPEKIIDYGYRGIIETTRSAKAIIKAFYGKPADYNYFAGCSNGGREALMAAQRFPEHWDGILVGAPANFLTFTEQMKVANERAQWSVADSHIPHTKLPAIQKAALASCTAEAYVVNGVATDPRFCPFDPSILACKGDDNDQCLTSRQTAALSKIYTGPKDPVTGQSIFPGLTPTFENTEGWKQFVFGKEPDKTPAAKLGGGFFSYMVMDDPALDIYNMDIEKAFGAVKRKQVLGQPLSSILNSDNPDLSTFKTRGGKMIMYYGWADEFLPPEGGIQYYEAVAQAMGGLEAVQSFYRLFMVPGLMHCARGEGANAFGQFYSSPSLKNDADHNIVRALEVWVEEGKAPEKITATKYANDRHEEGVDFTRLICLYPKVATYKEKGLKNMASSFMCHSSAQ